MTVLEFRKPYGIAAARVAKWNPSTETWGTSVAIPNLQGIAISPVHETDEKNTYGAREHLLSVLVSIEVTLDFVGKDSLSAQVMTGITPESLDSGATRKTRHVGGVNLPYFGLICQIRADDGGDLHLMIPYAKLDSLIGLQMDAENKFVVPNVTAKAARLRLSDNSLYPIWDELEHETLTDIETDFNTAFAPLS
ncbi:MAG: hypothetical protein D6698_16320 [Gammaproteobacteria bacterium]|nr:MAG: hypothetical protein D6698_16320 [Gammaproteobacteria bacterium]